ncbi:MAG: hypothetical protein A2X81_06500 [Desulfobacterales bacterium GWB2_56_26]|nr:MAG: hypothetical protein A2X81_06500 [Desulfobacterales bacterium GWB2_56_26]
MPTPCPTCSQPLDADGRCSFCGYTSRRLKRSSLFWLAAVFLILALGVGAYKYYPSSFLPPLFAKLLTTKDGEVRVAPPVEKVLGTAKPTFSLEELKRFRTLLRQKDFDTLNDIASRIQANFERDPVYEYQVNDFFVCFQTTLAEDEKLFDEWVKHSPNHFAPWLVRARFSYDQGWESRGTEFAHETTVEQFDNMHVFFIKCGKDLDVALTLNPRLLNAHIMRLFMANADGDHAEEARLMKQSSALFPTSFLMYQTMLLATLPRWGGSYEEMNDIAMRASTHIEANNELSMLFGMIFADQAWNLRKAKEYDKAIALYSKAILYGEHYSFFQERARTYYFMKDYDNALEDINRSIALRPPIVSPYSLRAVIYAATGRIDKAIADFSLAEELSPGEDDILQHKRAAANTLILQGHTAATVNPDQALASYDQALRIDPFSSEAFFRKGLLYAQSGQLDQAVPQFRRAIEYDPRDIKAVKAMDYTLMMQGRWDEIIGYWNGFLALEPDNGEAYLERAGTFHHKGDQEKSRADLKQACDLGQQKACSLLQNGGWK